MFVGEVKAIPDIRNGRISRLQLHFDAPASEKQQKILSRRAAEVTRSVIGPLSGIAEFGLYGKMIFETEIA